MSPRREVLFAAFFMTLLCPFLSAQQVTTPTAESCLTFVREFYRWYVPKAQNSHVDAIHLALKQRRTNFSQQLLKKLAEVDAERERSQDAGLDFDWLLNTQDSGGPGDPPFVASDSSLDGDTCRVHVSRKKYGEKIAPELEFEDGHWLFVNFHYPSPYPQSENLLSLIDSYLKPSRASRPE